MKTVARTVQVVGAFLAFLATTQAAIIFNTFGPSGGFDPIDYLAAAATFNLDPDTNSIRLAVQFPVGCNDYILNSITLPISVQKYGTTTNILRVRLTLDAGGTPGTTVEVLSVNQGVWSTLSNPFTNTTILNSTAHPVLSGGSNYWIVTEPTAMPTGANTYVEYAWSFSTNGPPVLFIQQQAIGSLPSDPWSGVRGSQLLAFRVDGTPLSAPSLSFRFSQVALCWPSCSNQVYQVQYASALNTNLWMNLGSTVTGDGSQQCVTDEIPAEGQPQRFYRLTLP